MVLLPVHWSTRGKKPRVVHSAEHWDVLHCMRKEIVWYHRMLNRVSVRPRSAQDASPCQIRPKGGHRRTAIKTALNVHWSFSIDMQDAPHHNILHLTWPTYTSKKSTTPVQYTFTVLWPSSRYGFKCEYDDRFKIRLACWRRPPS